MEITVPKNFLIKNIIIDKKEIFKNGTIDIDDCLVKEIKHLWRLGIHTRGCCCGHKKLKGYIEVERTDIIKMIKLGYQFYEDDVEKRFINNNFDRFIPKSICHCEI